ncbi:hypothetical protein K488DRAFT_84682 [Vararia minispora EC-137]|uniref:Uncharacterized protein n=1 Tax=Vararia minispora EC-137 TaxID=1314806 RepID=A0ACB8QPG3_9AGAM|nr:hypothetical protein K488DRAFT_84682 [Vararia minispora EC-137]
MARATRSSNKQDEKPKENGTLLVPKPSPGKASGKKRKRISNAESDDQPAPKQPRNGGDDDGSVKLEDGDILQEHEPDSEMLGTGDVPLDPRDAERILETLEKIDTQGLLDREFPLPPEALLSDPQPSNSPRSYSFRALLKDSSRYPARVLFAAVKPLFPVFSHPRSRPSGPAALQLKFCSLARTLLEQATRGTNPSVAKLETVIPSPPEDDASPVDLPFARRYALMQKLPTGEWWSSLNSESLDSAELKELPMGHAELVAILPTPVEPMDFVPTLAHYSRASVSALSKRSQRLAAGRRLSSGAFLDYGPHASFAPTFDQDGAEVGREALGEVLWWEERKRRLTAELAESSRGRRGKLPALPENVEMEAMQEAPGPSTSSRVSLEKDFPVSNGDLNMERDPTGLLDGLLPPDQIVSVKATLHELSLEAAIQELLTRTSKALAELEDLQIERLGRPDGGTGTIDPESEEFTLAESISESLALLASLRPQTADTQSIIPPSHILRQLHRTLPVAATPGWHGTLPDAHPRALQDDTTVHVKSGTVLPAPTPAQPAPMTPAAPKPITATAAASYSSYGYPTYAAGTYVRPTPGATTPYSYSSSSYYNFGQTGQTDAYAAWRAMGGQPWSYGATATTTPGRAVANTVVPNKTYAGWQPGGSYTPTIATRAGSLGQQTGQQ